MSALETRYASKTMLDLWSDKAKIMIERGTWLIVMQEQKVAPDVIQAYRKVLEQVDLDSIAARERATGHDLKARLDEFNALAGHQAAHHGLTSSDITENTTTWQIHQSIITMGSLSVAFAAQLAGPIGLYGSTPMVGRTHNLPAQVTTLGRRFAVCAQELAMSFNSLHHMMGYHALRGFQGAVGTAADLLRVMGGDQDRVLGASSKLTGMHEMHGFMGCVGQTPPRSQDAEIGALMVSMCSAPTTLATTIRLMVGQGLAYERAPQDTTGSSAMPHKMNPRYAERVCGLMTVVRGFASMLLEGAGGIWNEGDVSDSAMRRVALPGLFMAADGLFHAAMTMLARFDPDLEEIEQELELYRLEMKTGELLDACVRRGAPREDAHAAIRGWSRNTPLGDMRIGEWLDTDAIERILDGPWDLGMTQFQIDRTMDWITHQVQHHPQAAAYEPVTML